MQVDQAIMALSLLNAELVIQRDEARDERDALKNSIAEGVVQQADALAAKRVSKKK